jgi:hypothetical protein
MGITFTKGPELPFGASDFRNGWDVIETGLDLGGVPEWTYNVPDIPDIGGVVEDFLRPSSDDLVNANS